MNKHSDGAWEVQPYDDIEMFPCIQSTTTDELGSVVELHRIFPVFADEASNFNEESSMRHHSDMAILRQAPNLYDMLKELVESIEYGKTTHETLEKARALLDKCNVSP